MKRTILMAAIGASLTIATVAWARNTFLDIPVAEAKKSERSNQLKDVPFYMKGESHPKVARELGTFTSNRRTNAFNKSDRDACHIAFLSAVIALQERARSEGGNAVVDIRSITRHNDLDSRDQYRCVAGAVVANVVLTGRVVELAGKKK